MHGLAAASAPQPDMRAREDGLHDTPSSIVLQKTYKLSPYTFEDTIYTLCGRPEGAPCAGTRPCRRTVRAPHALCDAEHRRGPFLAARRRLVRPLWKALLQRRVPKVYRNKIRLGIYPSPYFREIRDTRYYVMQNRAKAVEMVLAQDARGAPRDAVASAASAPTQQTPEDSHAPSGPTDEALVVAAAEAAFADVPIAPTVRRGRLRRVRGKNRFEPWAVKGRLNVIVGPSSSQAATAGQAAPADGERGPQHEPPTT